MMQSLVYSLKVWFTCVVLAPLLLTLINNNHELSTDENVSIIGIMMVIGALFSLPSMLCLTYCTYFIRRFELSVAKTKLLLSVSAMIVTVIPLLIQYGIGWSTFWSDILLAILSPVYCIYLLVIVAGIWLYRLEPVYDIDAEAL